MCVNMSACVPLCEVCMCLCICVNVMPVCLSVILCVCTCMQVCTCLDVCVWTVYMYICACVWPQASQGSSVTNKDQLHFSTPFSLLTLSEDCRNPIVQILFLISTQINWENGLSLPLSLIPSLPFPYCPLFLQPSLFPSLPLFFSSFSSNFPPFSLFFLLPLAAMLLC